MRRARSGIFEIFPKNRESAPDSSLDFDLLMRDPDGIGFGQHTSKGIPAVAEVFPIDSRRSMVWNCREISSSMTHKGGLMSDTGKVNEDIPPKRSMTDDEIMQFLQRKRRQLHKRIALLEKRIARIEGYLERRCLE